MAVETGFSGTLKGRYFKIGLGGWAYTADFELIPPEPGLEEPVMKKGNKGIYFLTEHQLYTENENQGLAAFFRIGAADNRFNQTGYYVGAGLAYTGLIHGRNDDQLAIGMAHARNGKNFRQLSSLLDLGYETAETSIEMAYLIQLTPWLTLKPGFQYIIDPGTEKLIPNSFVLTFRSEISL